MDKTPLRQSIYKNAEEVLDGMLARARVLVEDGVVPRRPLSQCLRALSQVLTFISSQPLLRAEPALNGDVGRAVLRIAQELESPSEPPLPVTLPLSVEHDEAMRTAMLLLAAYRAAVERAFYGALPQNLAVEFGIGGEHQKGKDGLALADGIARFLTAATRFPEVVQAADLSPRQLAGLAAQERVLRAHVVQRRQQTVTPGLQQRVHIMHLSLDHFFDRFEAALGARLWDQPAYRSCRLTDSGRLIF